ncbi:Glycosyltransferase [Nitrospira sp. KM1]|uniref:glycosyltransferase family 4 protein n=1 Tax=Nitrospira sp. KM1 TaxID=1936990 RepID=UPI0013A7327C|nr:glycosyltransferase family 1 protein [Nitrospira sp. KM1]BCA52883.1 Glycosyltransferase [Nitrospira sp. KM1]
MRIAIVTDAWRPQVNGVVRTLGHTAENLADLGHDVQFITPQDFRTYPCPTYPSIRLALFPKSGVRRALERFRPQAIHIATEGPLGHAARALCLARSMPFTTSYHTQFPEYVRARFPIPTSWSYAYLRQYHGRASRTMIATPSMKRILEERGFRNLDIWARGVDTNLFKPGPKSYLNDLRPIAMYMGRVAVEKNIEAFLRLDVPGTKYVVGDGPDLERLRTRYPDARFVGAKHGLELTAYVAAADVFVFPSLTDTFGLVLLEAMACGVPVAAYPVTGPIDIIQNGTTGVTDPDLRKAVIDALTLDPDACIAYARQHSWRKWTERFVSLLEPFKEKSWE